MSCPNGKDSFTEFLYNSGIIDKTLSDTEKAYQRRRIYYTICIFIRLAIAGLLLQLKDKIWLPYVTLVFSLFAINNLAFYKEDGKQWWSNTFQLLISILMTIVSILLINQQQYDENERAIPTYLLSLIMFASVSGGVFQSLLIPSC